jgi:hypothetical protein
LFEQSIVTLKAMAIYYRHAMATTNTLSMADRAQRLIGDLEQCEDVTHISSGWTDSAVNFSLSTLGIGPDVMTILTDHDYYLAHADDSVNSDWIAVYDGR